ncbi:hypothetical protein GGU11DRAFT_761583, partial [Lentinula aff. detonsa]
IRYLAIQEGLDFRRKRKALINELLNVREIRGWPILVPTDSPIDQSSNWSAGDGPSNSFATPLSTAGEVQRDLPPDLLIAMNALLGGQPKKQLIQFSAETLRGLADRYGLQILTKGGKPSLDRSTLATALIAHRNQLPTTSQPRANSTPAIDSIGEEDALSILRYASKTAINHLSGAKLTAVYLATHRLRRQVMSNKGKATKPVPIDFDYEGKDIDDEASSGSGTEESWNEDAGPEQSVYPVKKTPAEMKRSIHKGRYHLGITSRGGKSLALRVDLEKQAMASFPPINGVPSVLSTFLSLSFDSGDLSLKIAD